MPHPPICASSPSARTPGRSRRRARSWRGSSGPQAGRGDLRDRLRALRPAPYRHLRRGRPHHHGAPRLPGAHRRQDQDPADRLLGRHGRLAQGARQRPQQGRAGGASGQAAHRRCPIRSARIPSFGAAQQCAAARLPRHASASSTSSCPRPTATLSGRFDATLLEVLERFDAGDGDHAAVAARRAARRPIRRSCRSRPRTGKVLQVPIVAHDAKAGTITYEDPDTREPVDHAGHRRALQAAMEGRLGDALGGARRRLRDGRQGSDRFRQAVGRDLPRARRHAARKLHLRAVPRRARPEDLQVQGQRPHHRRMAALCQPRKPVAVHVPRAEGGQAPLLRRHPAPGRRVSAIARRLSAAGPEAAPVEPGLARAFRPSARVGDADRVLHAADAGVVLERRERRDAVGLHRPLSSRRHAADPSAARRPGRLRHPLLSRFRAAGENLPRAERGRAGRARSTCATRSANCPPTPPPSKSRTWSTRSAGASRSST